MLQQNTTAIADALVKSGYDIAKPRLRAIAIEELQKTDVNVLIALHPFTRRVRDLGPIMSELVPYDTTRDFARRYLAETAGDMRPTGIGASSAPIEGERVRMAAESHFHVGSPSSTQSDGNGSELCVDAASTLAHRPPNEPRRLEALKIHAKVVSAFEFATSRGKIGALVWSALPRYAAESTREARLFKLIHAYATPAYPNACIAECVSEADLERLIQKATEGDSDA
jgi:hypothetical protein